MISRQTYHIRQCTIDEIVFSHKPVLPCYPLEVFLAILVILAVKQVKVKVSGAPNVNFLKISVRKTI